MESKSSTKQQQMEYLSRDFITVAPREPSSLRIATWNVLCQKLVDWFKLIPKQDLLWKNRAPKFETMFEEYDADLFNFQEVEQFEYSKFAEYFKPLGYKGYYHLRGDEKMGVAVFWRESKVTLKGKMNSHVYKCTGVQNCIYGFFRHEESESNVLIVNTHLKAMPDCAEIRMK